MSASIETGSPTGKTWKSKEEFLGCVILTDWILLVILFAVLLGSFHIHYMLLAGDWDFWIDFKDRRMWPTVTPIVAMCFAAAAQSFFWTRFRLPIGATTVVLALLIGEWINRYDNFWGWTFFPINLVFPSALIPMGFWLDIVLMISGSWLVTALLGGLGWGLLFYPINWPVLAQYHQAAEIDGVLLTLADLIGFNYVRTGTPEYIRMVERGTLRTFGKDVVPVAAFFSGFISMLVYFLWWNMGKWFSTTKYLEIEEV
ncbi:bacterial ammonia monooxygenase, subunit AmoA [Methylocystis sp. SC2]|uniref:bacterial ammonia monooxygenase, subunit AmoA n=1 Tax=Methylocystis sp. (strain SC2) TaxID=187303 RepID=UPI000035E694|nr:bacterial ammonia monooxygenase, subunit AmoA [Methylocystis sp. SC2]CAE48352.1 pmoA2 [Methylocystis sp. SC2]CCJ05654.1 Particulate methane monooxigenase subunit A, PmoA2 protein [Methylocystis sp. SC2]